MPTFNAMIVAASSAILFLTCKILIALIIQLKLKIEVSLLELRPNCLLTRYPICFVTEKSGFLQRFNTWQRAPLYLKEHGYQVVEITAGSLQPFLHQLAKPVHLIVDPEHMDQISQIRSQTPELQNKIKTLNCFASQSNSRLKSILIYLKRNPRTGWETEHPYLLHVISLAESDHV